MDVSTQDGEAWCCQDGLLSGEGPGEKRNFISAWTDRNGNGGKEYSVTFCRYKLMYGFEQGSFPHTAQDKPVCSFPSGLRGSHRFQGRCLGPASEDWLAGLLKRRGALG